MTLALKVTNLSKTYLVGSFVRRKVLALQGLDLSVEPGQIYGILGPNGAGKSTTIKIVMNLIAASSGTAEIFGRAPSDVEARKQIGFLPENPAPYEYLTGREFVTFCGQLAGLSGQELKKRVGEVIERVGMGDACDLQVRRYSKGMIQRIALAQALVGEPKLLVLDEPTSGLDVLGRQLIRDIVLEQKKAGTTVLFCSHIIPDVEALCDRVAVLVGGKLAKEGKVSELVSDERALMQATIEGATREAAAAQLGELVTSMDQLGDRLIIRFQEAHVREVLAKSLEAGWRVTSLQRTRFSLEELFINTLAQSGRRVGSQIE